MEAVDRPGYDPHGDASCSRNIHLYLAKLNKGEEVNTAILVKICNALNCGLEDIIEYHPKGMDKKRKAKDEK